MVGPGGPGGGLGSRDTPQQLLCPTVKTPWDTKGGSLWAERGRWVGAEPPPPPAGAPPLLPDAGQCPPPR